jgi:hypothetical protein
VDAGGRDDEAGGGSGDFGEFGVGVGDGFDDANRGDEAVAAAGECFDEAGILGGVAEGFADLVDGRAEGVVEVDYGVFTPEACLEFFAGDDLAGLFQEGGEDLEGLPLQLDAEACFPELPCLQIDLIEPEAEPRVANLAHHFNPQASLSEFTTSSDR